MKLCTFWIDAGFGGYERLGLILPSGNVLDLNTAYALLLLERDDHPRPYEMAEVLVPPDMVEFLRNREFGLEAASDVVESFGDGLDDPTLEGPNGEPVVYTAADLNLLAPLPRPNSIRQAMAFVEHARAIRSDQSTVPDYWFETPVYYKGNCDAVIGPDAEFPMPTYAEILDYSLCIAAVVGQDVGELSAAEGWDVIAGYTIFNDFIARDISVKEQACGMGPSKSTDMEGSNVLGPCLVTADEWDPRDGHAMIGRVNGEEWSRGSTRDMHHDFGSILAHVSRSETVRAGDVIGSGAVGSGWELGRQLKEGDVVELEVEGLGQLRTTVVSRD
ncbi:MAG: 2-keto-4-pentenoate hydratase/2-oxohepta-3-ene-1,7-dioic acid hydratase in catechol pathway [Hyphomicrobiaceae bacterium]|jgi:2-keto-4-pentenoate hydratase/2-oxohepta-3-ene-1,7-dioic acid hydratase in catechol pathway